MLTVRPATLADATEINAVSAHLGYAPLSDTVARAQLEALIASGDDAVYVAEIDRGIAGWIHLFRARRLASPAFHEIGGLVVDPAHRRQGVGQALVCYARDHLTGHLRVRCRNDRESTHRFYESLGFTDTKSQRVFELPAPDSLNST